jgi:hypothetical protein
MSYLIETAQRYVRDMRVANPGVSKTPNVEMRGPGGSRESGLTESYDTEGFGRSSTQASTNAGIVSQSSQALSSPAITTRGNTFSSPTGMTDEQKIRLYGGIGTSAASAASNLLKVAGNYAGSPALTSAGSALGKVTGAANLALTAYDIYNTGRVTPTQAAGAATVIAPAAISAINTATGVGIGANTIGLGAGTTAGVGSSTAAGASAGTMVGAYAALAIIGREALGAVLRNQSGKVPQLQGKLMREPTFEGLTGAVASEVARGVFHAGDKQLASMSRFNKAMDPVGSLMKNEFGREQVGDILSGGIKIVGEAAGLSEENQDMLSSGFSGGVSSLADVGKSTKATTNAVANILTGGGAKVIKKVFNKLCFVAGTRFRMEDGSEKNVEDISIGDMMYLGGMVLGRGEVLADNLYSHHGNIVEGNHAVFEEGKWMRVKDSKLARKVSVSKFKIVYPIINTNHLMVSNDTIYADLSETNQGTSASDEDRMTELNGNSTRNQRLMEVQIELRKVQ